MPFQRDTQALSMLRIGNCPSCHAAALIAGPWGGASRNVFCIACRVRYTLHGVTHGVLGFDNEGTCGVADIQHAMKTYGELWQGIEVDDDGRPERNEPRATRFE